MTPPEHFVAQALLRPLALVYRTIVGFRNRYYDLSWAVHRAALPVISVGNLTVGGTGKTPLVWWLAGRLLADGHKPAIVSRGYGGKAGRGPRIVSSGAGPSCGPEECGDEPFLLASILDGGSVIVGSNRCDGADAAADLGCDVVILDDGFQHRGLGRDLDIVLLDAANPFGNGRLLPAGQLREPPAAISRADVVLITRSQRNTRSEAVERVVRRHNPEVPILHAGHRRIGFFDSTGRAAEPPRRALAFCAIGNPQGFRIDLEAEGVQIVGFETWRDHHRYDREELGRLRARAFSMNAALVTTEKDRVRLPGIDWPASGPPLLTLRIEADPFDPEPLLGQVRTALARDRRR